MSTRASITIMEENDGKPHYMGVYLHFDGYLDHTGKLLDKHYDTAEKVWDLISGGSIRELDDNGKPNYFDDEPIEEAMVQADTYSGVIDHIDSEYDYLFIISEGQWYVTSPAGNQALLKEVLAGDFW